MTPAKNQQRERFLEIVRASVAESRCEKVVLSKPSGADPTLNKLVARPVTLRSGPMLSLVWTHRTRDITKNFSPPAGVAEIDKLLGTDFFDGHLFASDVLAQFSATPAGDKLHTQPRSAEREIATKPHDRKKNHLISEHRSWLRALGVTNDQGRPREGMAGKFRQIQKFAEILQDLIAQAFTGGAAIRVADMGSGKGYLTFALAELLGTRGKIVGVETRPDLVENGNRVAAASGFEAHLKFSPGAISEFPVGSLDILIALHACDTATDDALAHGIAAGAQLLVVSPCCQKELRPQLTAPAVLAPALRHGIFQERQAEFVTDALRAGLLDWAGYRTKVFEFISTEHTAKNLMIAATKERPKGEFHDQRAEQVRGLARFYGIRSQALARHLQFPL